MRFFASLILLLPRITVVGFGDRVCEHNGLDTHSRWDQRSKKAHVRLLVFYILSGASIPKTPNPFFKTTATAIAIAKRCSEVSLSSASTILLDP